MDSLLEKRTILHCIVWCRNNWIDTMTLYEIINWWYNGGIRNHISHDIYYTTIMTLYSITWHVIWHDMLRNVIIRHDLPTDVANWSSSLLQTSWKFARRYGGNQNQPTKTLWFNNWWFTVSSFWVDESYGMTKNPLWIKPWSCQSHVVPDACG